MSLRGRLSLLGAAAVLVAACSSGGATTAPPPRPQPRHLPPTAPGPRPHQRDHGPGDARLRPATAPIAGGLLDKVLKAGKIVMSTDPQYPPQSSLKSDGTLRGLRHRRRRPRSRSASACDIAFETPDWNLITAGSWGGPLGLQRRLDDDHHPAREGPRLQQAVLLHAGPDGRLDGIGDHHPRRARRQDHLRRRGHDLLRLADRHARPRHATPRRTARPRASTATTLSTDRLCAETWKAGRKDFEGWLSSSTTVEQAVKDGLPLVKVGDPVYYEPLGVAFDKSGPDPTDMVAKVNTILADMRADGTLKAMSEKWFGTRPHRGADELTPALTRERGRPTGRPRCRISGTGGVK